MVLHLVRRLEIHGRCGHLLMGHLRLIRRGLVGYHPGWMRVRSAAGDVRRRVRRGGSKKRRGGIKGGSRIGGGRGSGLRSGAGARH
jgi:hypothetical protein